jgi:hypothetical protein
MSLAIPPKNGSGDTGQRRRLHLLAESDGERGTHNFEVARHPQHGRPRSRAYIRTTLPSSHPR